MKSGNIIVIKNTNCPPCSQHHSPSPVAMNIACNPGITVIKWLPKWKNLFLMGLLNSMYYNNIKRYIAMSHLQDGMSF